MGIKRYTSIFTSVLTALAVLGAAGCNGYLNVVPDDGMASVEKAFNLRSRAIQYLATCYSYLPHDGESGADPALLGSDEFWDLYGRIVSNTSGRVPSTMSNIARGNMSANYVYSNNWASLYQGIRCCDILIENVDRVPDMDETEKIQWKAEADFLKAYFHFELVRKWGPIPVIYESLPIDTDVEHVRLFRNTIDECFDHILGLLDKAEPNLPLTVISSEFGRVSQSVCAAFRARVAVYAASPLFNGNEEEASLVDKRGTRLFPAKSEADKLARWTYAMEACEHALDVCENEASYQLFTKEDLDFRMVDSLKTTLALRDAFNLRSNIDANSANREVIWGNTQSSSSLMLYFQRLCQPILSEYTDMLGGYRFIGVPLKIAEQFYTSNGLPISNDSQWASINPYETRSGDAQHSFFIEDGHSTAKLNFNREPRFYAFLGFDGGKWLGQLANFNDLAPEDVPTLFCRLGSAHGKTTSETGPVTGYFPKKLFPNSSRWTAANTFSSYYFAWPNIRLVDLYLLYAEAINEAEGPAGPHSAELFSRLDAVRARAGIPDVKTSWDEYSNMPGYYNSQVGMRDIIHKERLNELAFECHRFWDLRRWKEAAAEYEKGIYGFTVTASVPEDYCTRQFIYEQKFGLKDYFWPIPISFIEVNNNLVQNIGW